MVPSALLPGQPSSLLGRVLSRIRPQLTREGGLTPKAGRKTWVPNKEGVGLAARSQDGRVGTAYSHVLPPHPCCVCAHAWVNTHTHQGLSVARNEVTVLSSRPS